MGFFRNSFSRRNFLCRSLYNKHRLYNLPVCSLLLSHYAVLYTDVLLPEFLLFLVSFANCTGVSLNSFLRTGYPCRYFSFIPCMSFLCNFFHQKTALYYSPCSRYLLCSLLPHKSQLSHCVALYADVLLPEFLLCLFFYILYKCKFYFPVLASCILCNFSTIPHMTCCPD